MSVKSIATLILLIAHLILLLTKNYQISHSLSKPKQTNIFKINTDFYQMFIKLKNNMIFDFLSFRYNVVALPAKK